MLRRRARNLQAAKHEWSPEEFKSILEEAAVQIEVIACLHQLLSLNPQHRTIDIDDYLRAVCNTAVSSLSTADRVFPEYELNCRRQVAPEFAVSIALGVAELLTNSIKYAHPTGIEGRIVVAASSRGDDLAIEVADDGVGLPEGYDPASDGGLGLRLVRATAERWGGKVEFEASELGLRVRLLLPAEAGRCE